MKSPEPSKDHAPVPTTALDYLEGWFDGDVERISGALHPALGKRPLRQVDPAPELRTLAKDRVVALTAEGEGKRENPADRRIEVEVVDVHGSIATLLIRSAVYRGYLHLVRTDESSKMVNAPWHFE